ncbi:MAG: hypothetical protein AAFY88_09485, partial [Acidobacteriota bacterium]
YYPAPVSDIEIWLGDLATQIGNVATAEQHYNAALEVYPRHPDALGGLAYLRHLEDRRDEAGVLFRDAVAEQSRQPHVYLRYGRYRLAELLGDDGGPLMSSGSIVASSAFARSSIAWLEDPVEEERAKAEKEAADGALEAFKLAHAGAPAHAGSQVYLGIGHLYADVDPSPGIRALREVRQWLPQDRGLAFYQLQLHLKKKEFDVARRLLTQDIGDAYPDLSLRAIEEIDRAELIHRAGLALEAGDQEAAFAHFDEAISITGDIELRERMEDILHAFQLELEGGAGARPASPAPSAESAPEPASAPAPIP